MSDDRSPTDGWFREEPGIPPRADGPQQGPASADDSPTQVAGFPAVPTQPGPAAYVRPEYQGSEFGRPPLYGEQPAQAGQAWQQPQPAQPPQPPAAPQVPAQPLPRFPVRSTTFGQGAQAIPQPPQVQPQPPQSAYQPTEFSYPEYQPHPHDRRGGSGRPNRVPMIAGGAVAGVAVLSLIAYLALNHGGAASPHTRDAAAAGAAASPSPTHTSFQPSSADPAAAAEQTGTAFLTAWQSGDFQEAAKYTDDPTDALAALTAYKSGLNLSALTLKPGAAVLPGASASAGASPTSTSSSASAAGSSQYSVSGTVPFAATATVGVSGQKTTAPWSYSSSLVAFKQSDGWSVHWTPSILAPGLTDGQKLAAASVPPGAGKVTDAGGTRLSAYSDTAMQNINAALQKKAPSGQGTAGIAVEVLNSHGKVVSGSADTVLKPVNTSVVKTTISPTYEALARTAVSKFARSSMVVLRPSTGAILAIANSSGAGDTALSGGLAPGSTWKIVTSTALLNYGYVSLYTPVACPLTVTVQGVVYHNSSDGAGKEESLPIGTPFLTDFAQSCNNAFTPFYKQLDGGKLAHTASAYFGLNQDWDIGLGPNTYASLPSDSSGAELAQENFGQGQVVASPLAMASVAATAGTGSFHQPYLVDGVTKVTANALPSGTASSIKTLMHAVVTTGTAAGVFSGDGTVYAKTGTAETDANKDGKNNAWIVVYDPSQDVAIGVVVQDSGFGATYAGPEAQYVLSHL
jgi:hypothetical protein